MTLAEGGLLALSGALTALTCSCVVAGLWRAVEVGKSDTKPDRTRRHILFRSAILLIFALAWQQTYATVAWELGIWKLSDSGLWWVIPPRVIGIIALVGFGGAALWPSCKHRGWLALVAIAVLGGVGTLML